jgi:hypothetical protein
VRGCGSVVVAGINLKADATKETRPTIKLLNPTLGFPRNTLGFSKLEPRRPAREPRFLGALSFTTTDADCKILEGAIMAILSTHWDGRS